MPPHPLTRPLVWAGVALSLGLLVALLPFQQGAVLFAGVGLIALSVWRPAFGLGCALLLGPTRAYLFAVGYWGLLFDFGQIFFGLALAGWLLRGALKRDITVPRLGFFLPLSAYFFVGLLSLLGAQEWRDGLKEAIKWLEIILTLMIALDEVRHGRLNWIIAAILLTGLAQASLGLWQYKFRGTGPESFRLAEDVYRAYGTFEQPNPFGGFLGLIWPLSAGLALERMKAKLGSMEFTRQWFSSFILHPSSLWLGIAAICLAGLYVSFSRGAWLGAAAAAFVMAIFLPRRLSLGLALGIGGLVGGWLLISAGLLPANIAARFASVAEFTSFGDMRGVNITLINFAIVERLAHWQAALEMARAHPWLGVGLGNYIAAYPHYALFNWPFHLGHAHNIYLHVLAETGVIGLLAYLSIWATALALTVQALRNTTGWQRGLALGLLGVWAHLLAHQMVDNLHVNNNDLLIAAQLALLCTLRPFQEPGGQFSSL